MSIETEKPSYEEWVAVAETVIERLTTCVKVYAHPPFDVFLIEKEQTAKKAATNDLLTRIHVLTDSAAMPTDSLADVAHHDEQVIQGLAVLLRETLDQLPQLSIDMQKLLKSPWIARCNGQTAETLFRGPHGDESKGIGSGHPEHGRLPEVLSNMLEREQIGDSRQPRTALHRDRAKNQQAAASGDQPLRHTEAQRRWADKNGGHFRSAGGLE